MTDILTPESKRRLDRFVMHMRGESSDIARTEAHGVVRGTGGGVNAATLAGDVTGRLVSTVVERIRGLLVSTAAPAVGDTLRWNGSHWAPAAVAGSGPLTTYTNWAVVPQGASATASSNSTGFGSTPTNAIDADDSSFWASAFASGIAGEWLRIDLGAARAIDSYRLYQQWYNDFGFSSAKLQSSTNGTTWTDRETLTGPIADSGPTALSGGVVTARYWRLLGVSGPIGMGNYWRINSLELLQSATTPAVTAGHTIQDEGTPRTQRAALDFVGTGVAATDGPGDKTTVTIAAGGHTIEDEGTPLTQRTSLNFVGAGVSVADSGGKTVVTVPSEGVTDATYVTRTAHAGLSAEVLLSEVYAHELKTRYEPLSNGDASFPELIFLDGDPIMMEVVN